MLTRTLLLVFFIVCLLGLGLLPRSASATAGWQASPGSAVAVCAVDSLLVLQPAGDPGAILAPLPSSVLPHTDAVCSLEAGEAVACSTFYVPAGSRCSAYTDEAMRCSAFDAPAGRTGWALCSVGDTSDRCSVLLPTVQIVGASECSVFVARDSKGTCSTIEQTAPRMYCTAANGGARVHQDRCSTLVGNQIQSRNFCSVFNGQAGSQHYCTISDQGNSLCSAFAAFTGCSIRQRSHGGCTVFKGAPSASCSSFVSQTRCSVIFVSTGSRCIVP